MAALFFMMCWLVLGVVSAPLPTPSAAVQTLNAPFPFLASGAAPYNFSIIGVAGKQTTYLVVQTAMPTPTTTASSAASSAASASTSASGSRSASGSASGTKVSPSGVSTMPISTTTSGPATVPITTTTSAATASITTTAAMTSPTFTATMILSPTNAILHSPNDTHDTCSWSTGAPATCVHSAPGAPQATSTQTVLAVAASVAPAPGRFGRWGSSVPDSIVPWIILPAVAGLFGIGILVTLLAR